MVKIDSPIGGVVEMAVGIPWRIFVPELISWFLKVSKIYFLTETFFFPERMVVGPGVHRFLSPSKNTKTHGPAQVLSVDNAGPRNFELFLVN